MNRITILLAALVVVCTLVSGKVDINIEHHLNAPKELANPNEVVYTNLYVQHLFKQSLYKRQIDITLGDVVKGHYPVREVVDALQTAQKTDHIIFHIAGYGGVVDSTLLIINSILNTKAFTTMSVESPSFSGHAYIAVSGNELFMSKYSYIMFHTSSGYGMDCNKKRPPGTNGKDDPGYDPEELDRTVPNKEHCQVLSKAHINTVNKFLDSVIYLTRDEKEMIKKGHDVIINSDGTRIIADPVLPIVSTIPSTTPLHL